MTAVPTVIPEAAAARVPDYTSAEISDAGVRIRAHRNESAAIVAPAILAALRGLTIDDLRRYPAGRYQALATIAGCRLNVQPEGLAFANGSDDVILALATAYLAPGTNVVVARPTFGMYARAARLHGASVREVPCGAAGQPAADALVAACDATTRIVFLAHPGNPTAAPLARATVYALLAAFPHTLVIVDEAYLANPRASFTADVGRFDNLAVIATLSKIAGLAGLRCGYAVAPPEVASAIRRVMQPHPLSVPALIALEAYFVNVYGDQAYRDDYEAGVDASLTRIVDALGPRALRVTRGSTNFVVLEFGERAPCIARALAAAGIAVRTLPPGDYHGGLRMNALSPAQTDQLVAVALGSLEPARA